MLYLFIITVCHVPPLLYFASMLREAYKLDQPPPPAAIISVGWSSTTVLALDVALFLGAAHEGTMDRSLNGANLTPAITLVASVICLITFLWHGLKHERLHAGLTPRIRGLDWVAAHASMAGGVCCLYLLFTCVDHYLFFYGDRNNTGVAAEMVYIETDVHCDFGIILVQLHETEAIYRCPKVLLGSPLGTPFVPWPYYTQGTSKALRERIRKLENEATKLDSK